MTIISLGIKHFQHLQYFNLKTKTFFIYVFTLIIRLKSKIKKFNITEMYKISFIVALKFCLFYFNFQTHFTHRVN